MNGWSFKYLAIALFLSASLLTACGGGGGGTPATADTTAPTTIFSLAGGTYSSSQTVTITTNEAATIYYTTDGTTPTTASAVYSGAISITANTTLKCFAVDSAGNSGSVKTETYIITTVPWVGTRQMGVAGVNTGAVSVATDISGNIFVAGLTDGGLDGNSLTGTTDSFVTKYDSAGAKQWTKQLGAAGADTFGFSVATDTSGNIFVVGWTDGGLDGNSLTGTQDFFVTKYDSAGVKQWTKQLGAAGVNTGALSVATDNSGNIVVAGTTDGGLDGNSLTGTLDFFVTKYDSAGVRQWTKQLGVAGAQTGSNTAFITPPSVATDISGNIFVAGLTDGGLDGNSLTGTSDFFVTKYDPAGVKQWTKQMGVAGVDTIGLSVATDNSGNIFIAGGTKGGLDGNSLTGTSDFFVTKYDSAGVKQWTKQMGVAGVNTGASSVATDNSGNIFVAGGTEGGLDGNILTGTTDFFVTKYDPAGVKQ